MQYMIGGLCGFVFGMSVGYRHCRKLLHSISLNEAGKEITARIFGYPYTEGGDR